MAGCPRPAESVGTQENPFAAGQLFLLRLGKLRPPCRQKYGFGALEDAYCQHPMRAQKLCLDTSIGQSDPGRLSIALSALGGRLLQCNYGTISLFLLLVPVLSVGP